MRKLTVALNEKGEKIIIDNLFKEDLKGPYFCPICKTEVIPKQGNNKIWHFAHKFKDCEHGKLREEDKKTHNDSLGHFMQNTTSVNNYKFSEPTKFICPLCHETHSIQEGNKWSPKEYICKKCYKNITPEQTKMLMDRNI